MPRFIFAAIAYALSLFALTTIVATAAPMPGATQRDGSHDFDFLAGSWTVRHTRLRHPLTGSHDWYSFSGTTSATLFWNGGANIDDNVLRIPSGTIKALSIRLYDAKTKRWSIYWATNVSGLTTLPTVGAFDGRGIGRFYDRETYHGKAVVVRYTWSHITRTSCRWEQAFSRDGGTTWETNWRMDFTRAS